MKQPNMSWQAVKKRLLETSSDLGYPYDIVLRRYLQDRVLYRVSVSRHSEHFMIKGGLLVTALMGRFLRGTKDIDVRGMFSNEIDVVRAILCEALATTVSPDGIAVLHGQCAFRKMKRPAAYPGVTCEIPLLFGHEPWSVSIDVGFGDPVYLPKRFTMPTLIDGIPPVEIAAYSRESVIAEKLEAMALLATNNTRFKDFADVAMMSAESSIAASELWAACDLTFTSRGTPFERLEPAILESAATADRERLYQLFLIRTHGQDAPPTLARCLVIVRALVDGIDRFRTNGIERSWNGAALLWDISDT